MAFRDTRPQDAAAASRRESANPAKAHRERSPEPETALLVVARTRRSTDEPSISPKNFRVT